MKVGLKVPLARQFVPLVRMLLKILVYDVLVAQRSVSMKVLIEFLLGTLKHLTILYMLLLPLHESYSDSMVHSLFRFSFVRRSQSFFPFVEFEFCR